jgi:Flavodoxins
MSNILIVYYSHSGNTRIIAECIREKTQGDLFEVEPVSPYPTSYNAVVEQAKKEIQAGFRPHLKGTPEGIESYDTVFVGSPIWWHTMAPPVATLLAGCDWAGKTVIPFCTHGGGGEGRMERDIAELCSGADCKTGLVVSGNGGGRLARQVTEWLRAIGMDS